MKGPIKQNEDRKNRVRKRRFVGMTYGMKYSLKGHKTEIDTTTEQNEVGKLIYVFVINHNIPGRAVHRR